MCGFLFCSSCAQQLISNVFFFAQVRRLITLIDALYEHKVLVMVLADAPIMDLFSADRVPAPLSVAKTSPSAVQAAGSIVQGA